MSFGVHFAVSVPMRHTFWRTCFFLAERIRMICLALALLAAWKAFGGALQPRLEEPPNGSERAAMAQP
jgi:hypothetical protein